MQVKNIPDVAKPVPRQTTVALEQLYPPASILADIVDLARENTDLPPLAALFGAYSQISSAMAQSGFTMTIGGDCAVSPNLQLGILVGDDADPAYLLRPLVEQVIITPKIIEIPAGMTSASLFAHAKANVINVVKPHAGSPGPLDSATQGDPRCVSLVRLVDAEDWLHALHCEPNLGKLRRQLHAGCNGQPLYQYTKKDGDEYTPPLHLSMLVACRQSAFFTSLAGRFFTSSLIRQLLIVLADDRPPHRKPLYATDGIAAAAQVWDTVWRGVLAGPRAYVPTAEAEAEYKAWWVRRLTVDRDDEYELRRVGRAVWKYALVIQSLLAPDGSIGIEAIRIALSIADRHLGDQRHAAKKLAWETADDELTRKIAAYILDHPKAPRGKVMNGVRGASDPATLNRLLLRIAEIYEGEWLSERALQLRAAARTIGNGDVPRPRF